MAERIVSAGVFTNEVDQSFLPAAIGAIGAVVVGPTQKGPALVPTTVSSYAEFQKTFGSYTDESYVPFTAEEYLRNGDTLTVVRLLYEGGYSYKNGALAVIASSGSVKAVTHVLHPTQTINYVDNATNVFEHSSISNFQSGSFNIVISGSFTQNTDVPGQKNFINGTLTYSASIDSNKNNYITKVFGQSPKSVDYPVYVQYENPAAISLFASASGVTVELAKISDYSFAQNYQPASTPKVTSQKIGSAVRDLFSFATLSHGTGVNSDVKIGIRDIKLASEVSDPNGYGQFTVEVRRINTTNIPTSPYSSRDTDQTPDIVETFLNVNLDPDSANYIGRRIGDRHITISADGDIQINGDYPNQSKYIRVIIENGVKNKTNEKSLVPFGFRAPTSPIPNVSGSINLTAVAYKTTQLNTAGVYSPVNYLGFDYTNINNLNYLAPVPDQAYQSTGSNSDFYLGNVSQDAAAGYPSLSTAYSASLETAYINGEFNKVALETRKFILPVQGGFDGARPNLPKFSGANIKNTNVFGFDCSTSTSAGTTSYRKAFSLLSNADFYDFNMLITPGILDSEHSVVTGLARNLCVARQDAFYVMDAALLTDSIADVVSQINTIDNNYTATYWPWVRILNREKNVPVWVPTSVVVPGALSFNDKFAAPWYAPAGLNRGGLSTVLEAYVPLSQAQRNTLYDARVNPIATFPNDGIVVWGQKTLQGRASALDRVNVRRLLITVKKFIASSTRYLVFEQSNITTRNRFLNIVNPYLESVRAAQGLSIFKVVMDDTNNTPDLIDRNILYGQIFLQPTRTAEYIILDFNIQPTGAVFPE